MKHDFQFLRARKRAVESAPGTLIARAGLILAAVALIDGLIRYAPVAYAHIWFPYEIDYGEGIVWQQMREIVASRGYAGIDGFSAIVFHYPPVYHLLAAALAAVTGLDQLAAGRMLSLGATLASVVFAGAVVTRIAGLHGGIAAARICGVLAALIMLSLSPINTWSTYMRVDMVALALSTAGLFWGVRAIEHPRAVYLAAFCFVAAVYTKQTSIAAPAAVFATLFYLRPRTALAGLAMSLALGLAALAALTWTTDGGFLRHILLYNLNRFEPVRLINILIFFATHSLYLAAAVGVGVHQIRRSREDRSPTGAATLRERLGASPADAALLMFAAYLLASTLMLATVAKSGSSVNYLIEWSAGLAMATGLAARNAASAAIGAMVGTAAGAGRGSASLLICLVPLAIAWQAMLLPDAPDLEEKMSAGRRHELDALAELVRAAPRPVISDDMVLLLRGGQPVVWEPAIFAELASKGVWDEARFVARIQAREFGLFITAGDRGDQLFDSRYNPAVAAAIHAAYPRRRRLAGRTLHMPPIERSKTTR